MTNATIAAPTALMADHHETSPWRNTRQAARRRKMVTVTLSDEARAQLRLLALRYGSMSAAIEVLLLLSHPRGGSGDSPLTVGASKSTKTHTIRR